MSSMHEYIQKYGHLTFKEEAFNEIDALILNEIVYLPIEHFISHDFDKNKAISLKRLFQLYQPLAQYFMDRNAPLASLHRTGLIEAIAESVRYQSIQLFAFQNKIDFKIETQSAYLCMIIDERFINIIYRGTDDLIIGWKEDFMLAYQSSIPAQLFATQYLQNVLNHFPEEKFILTGHSKGGHLALYAAGQISETDLKKIFIIYTFDSPGHHLVTLKRKGMIQASKKQIRIVPNDSIVGMMLFHLTPPIVIKSKQAGFKQHDVSNWIINKRQLARVKQTDVTSRMIDKANKEWLKNYSPASRKYLTQTIFTLINATQARSINEWYAKPQLHLSRIRSAFNQLELSEQNELKSSAKLYLKCLGRSFKGHRKEYFSYSWIEAKHNFLNILRLFQSIFGI